VPHLVVNGRDVELTCTPATSLLAALRDELGDTTVKAACGSGECGTCTVLMGDVPVLACCTLVGLVDAEVHTAAGLAEATRELRGAFADAAAFQCGFCTPGQVVAGHAVLARGVTTRDEVACLMSGVLCRCTGSVPIVDVVARLAARPAAR
jgi:aerobic-type carbon monoxide dehydrogenase small subunit (CoxS/CutS family)